MLLTWIVACLALTTVSVRGQAFDAGDEINERLQEIDTTLPDLLAEVQKKLLPQLLSIIAQPEISSECAGGITALTTGVRKREMWAMMIASASGTLPQNMMLGAVGMQGSYDQCLATERIVDNKTDLIGQYCSVNIYPSQDMFEQAKKQLSTAGGPFGRALVKMLRQIDTVPETFLGERVALPIGICTVSSCSEEEVDFIVKQIVDKYKIRTEVDNCHTIGEPEPDARQRTIIGIGFFMLFLLVLGTAVDYYHNRKVEPYEHKYVSDRLPVTIIMMFSVPRNIVRLFTEYTEDSYELGFVNGIRALLAMWVVLCHVATLAHPVLIQNATQFGYLTTKMSFQIIGNGFMSLAAFFFLSGFLVGYLSLKDQKKLVKQNPYLLFVIMYVRRWLRIILPCMFVLMFSYLLTLWTTGPLIIGVDFYIRNCPGYWWTIPAVMTNWIGIRHMCIPHTWYTSVDMQCFFVCAICTLIMLRRPRLGITLCCLTIFASCLTVFLLTYINHYTPIMTLLGYSVDEMMGTGLNINIQPYTHVSCYFMGLFCGWLCYNYKDVKLSWYTHVLGWLVAWFSTSYPIFMPVIWYRYDTPGDFGAAAFAGLHRWLFTVGLTWLTFAILNGSAYHVRTFLSCSALRILGRLAYGCYLCHVGVLIVYIGRQHVQSFVPDEFLFLHSTLGVVCMGMFFSFLLNVCIESPISHMETMLFARMMGRQGPPPKPKSEKELEAIDKAQVAIQLDQNFEEWKKNSKHAEAEGNTNMAFMKEQESNLKQMSGGPPGGMHTTGTGEMIGTNGVDSKTKL